MVIIAEASTMIIMVIDVHEILKNKPPQSITTTSTFRWLLTILTSLVMSWLLHQKKLALERRRKHPSALPIHNLNLTHPSTHMIVTKQPRLSPFSDFLTSYGELRNKANSVICTVMLHIHYPTLWYALWYCYLLCALVAYFTKTGLRTSEGSW